MKQIYYTQCPIGYGLGASNGFQIKRLTPGYPVTGDFRHFGLRAFVAGTRTMAPPALRYRRMEDGAAEVAWLNPRSHEYETERGLWGRPGGHFAHGLLLDDRELESIGNWPAGLYDSALWTRSDALPSRGEPPEPRELTAADLRLPPDFDAFARLDPGDDVDRLARLLTSLAAVVREGRTLFLIDEPERNAARIPFLTLAFPADWRPAITFSTYHDRPEELPGFRVQGSTPAARPNRFALLSQGIVADLAAGVFEPALAPARWARTLAGWLQRRGEADRRAWDATGRRARVARSRGPGEAFWDDEWLDLLYGFDDLATGGAPVPAGPGEWAALADAAAWATRLGLGEELVPARPPAWWKDAARDAGDGHSALLAHLSEPSAWRREDDARAWGEAVAAWLGDGEARGRTRLVGAAVDAAPQAARPAFVRAMVAALPGAEARDVLRRLEAHPSCDRALLLPLGVRAAVDELVERRDPRRVRSVLEQAFALPAALPAVLDALAAEGAARPATLDGLAALLAGALETADRRRVADVLRWALRQGDGARTWLGPFLRRTFADATDLEGWRALAKLVQEKRRGAFARVVLEVGRDPGLPDEAFRWGLEELLLPLPEPQRPHEPAWPGAYLDRTPSGLDLLKRMFAKEFRKLGAAPWLEQARGRGELSAEQQQRLDECARYARALRTGDARSLLSVKLPSIAPEERGAMLAQILRHLGGDPADSLNLALDTCRTAWPRAFEAGRSGLRGLAAALAEPLRPHRGEPATWFATLNGILARLGLTSPPGAGYEPDGLAAELVAETVRMDGAGSDPWRLRQFLFDDDVAWRALAADVRRELAGRPAGARLDPLGEWDHRITKGTRTARFFELWLNACDGPTLAAAVAARAAELRTLGPLPWWASARVEGAVNDLRDGFARLAPMAPIPEEGLTAVRDWVRPPRRPGDRTGHVDLVLLESDLLPESTESSAGAALLSPSGLARWRCLEALSSIHRGGLEAESCWQSLVSWTHDLPLGRLDGADRYRFLGWFLARVDEFDAVRVARLAKWLFECGVADADRISRWHEELEPIASVSDQLRLARAPLVGELRVEIKNVVRDARQSPRKSPSADSPGRP